jgi:AcrR family transcriptional regulator
MAIPATGRERVLEAAYDLFSRQGVRAVGVDRILSEAGVAKMTLYRNFASKEALALAFMELREERWTHAWLRDEIERRGATPRERLLAIFDVFGEWFAREDFEGCAFISILLELSDPADPVRSSAIKHLANIRSIVGELAREAGVEDIDDFARKWHILMKGSIVAATEGDRDAATRAQEMGALLLEASTAPGA